MKKNFENTESFDIFDTFKPYEEKEKEAQEEVKTTEIIETPIKEETPLKTDKNTLKNSKKVAREKTQKKSQIYSEVDSIVCDYLNLKTIVTKKSKRDILEEIFKEEIKKSFNLPENATDEEMRKEIDKKLKQIEQMKNLFN